MCYYLPGILFISSLNGVVLVSSLDIHLQSKASFIFFLRCRISLAIALNTYMPNNKCMEYVV